MSNESEQRRRNALSGASIVLGGLGALAAYAAYDHVQAQEENRESIVQSVGRWIRETVGAESNNNNREAGRSSPSSEIPVRLSPAELNVLPVRTVSGGEDGARQEDGDVDEKTFCVFCRESYSRGDKLLRLPCFHEFHQDCIRDYLESAEEPRCPICRHPVIIRPDAA